MEPPGRRRLLLGDREAGIRERLAPECLQGERPTIVLIGDGELALMDPVGELDTGQSRWPHRGVSVVQPIFCAIDWIASDRVGNSCTCSWKSRTARSRISARYLVDALPVARSSEEMEPPGNPARFKGLLRPGFILAIDDENRCSSGPWRGRPEMRD
jgi:hypothetical protein